MLMPIVSMNEMAMNESIAAGCCYREAVSGTTNVYWQTLYGGWIGSGYVAKTPSAISGWVTNWKAISGDWKLVSNGSYATEPVSVGAESYVDAAGATKYRTTYTQNGVTYTSLEQHGYALGQSCDHSDKWTCKYYAVPTGGATELVNNYHFESTTKHNGNAAGVAHSASGNQYNS